MSKLKEKIITEIKKIYDPEIPVNIYELGLIYKIEVNEENKVIIEMTLKEACLKASRYGILLKLKYNDMIKTTNKTIVKNSLT